MTFYLHAKTKEPPATLLEALTKNFVWKVLALTKTLHWCNVDTFIYLTIIELDQVVSSVLRC